jgi:hypothetical protein
MELLAEIFIVAGVMLPGALLALSSGLHGHILNAVIKAVPSFPTPPLPTKPGQLQFFGTNLERPVRR